ncbi:MAG: alanine racemase [Acidobacteriota bacterium]
MNLSIDKELFEPALPLDQLETPSVVIDLDIMEKNLNRMSEYCRAHGLALRPHTKTHKIPELAHMQIQKGACGVTVAKPGEAEVMFEGGVRDLLVAYPVFQPAKAARLAELAREANVCVSLDSDVAARGLSQAAAAAGVEIAVLVEVDVGLGRCGLPAGQPAVDLARLVAGLPGLRFKGLMFYPGHIRDLDGTHQSALAQLRGLLESLYQLFATQGLKLAVVSGGSTPTALLSHQLRGVTEIRPGTYIFNDTTTVYCGACAWEDCAVSVVTTVVSTAVQGRAIVDGGSKTFSSDLLRSGPARGFGHVREDPDIYFEKMNEEHGYLDITRASGRLKVGDRLRIIPNHVCTTVNMHNVVYGMKGGQVGCRWRVAARGLVQ